MRPLAEDKKIPQLLVSVIDAEEAKEALAGGADIIDIKNPFEGALGTPQPGSVAAIQPLVQGRRPLSVALGDYGDTPGTTAMAALGAAFLGADYVKIAFPWSSRPEEIRDTLRGVVQGLKLETRGSTQVVGVAYADMLPKAQWKLEEFAESALQGGAAGCLLDTCLKNGESLLQVLAEDAMALFIQACRQKGLFVGLAGSLRPRDLARVAKLRPDLIGVRSAACGGDRMQGRVQSSFVVPLKKILWQEWGAEPDA